MHVHSLGGSPFDGVAIANALRDQRMSKGRTVETLIEGIAASAATIITSAGNPITIWNNALMMIHDPIALTLGTAAEHRTMASGLDSITESIIQAYRWTVRTSVDELRAMMRATTWFDADEAVAAGFATTKRGAAATAKTTAPVALLEQFGPIPQPHQARLAGLVDVYRDRSRGLRYDVPRDADASAGLDSAAIYAARSRRTTEDGLPAEAAPATSRPAPRLGELAREIYGPPQGASGDLIRTTPRGGAAG